jgi:predicted nucleic acid-binding Zn ribbon protein
MNDDSDDPMPVTASIDRILQSLRAPARGQVQGVFGRWEEIVGPQIAAHVVPIRLDGDLLVVEVDDPAWATQVKMLTSDLRRRLAEDAEVTIGRIEVQVRGARRPRGRGSNPG